MRDFYKISDSNSFHGNNSKTILFHPVNPKKINVITPLISLIVPTFQEEKILETTLLHYPESLKDKYRIELIVSDGGSSDNTLNIAHLYADKVLEYSGIKKQTIAQGRNLGAAEATGEILVFINADTIPENPDYFFKTITEWHFGTNGLSNCDALACKVYVSSSQIIFKDRIFYFLHNSYVKFMNTLGMGMGRGECQIIKRDVFRRVDGYNPNIAAGEDFDLYRRIARTGKINYSNKLIVFESPRRFRKYGYLKVLWQWVLNSISVILCGRSVSDEWEAVR